jgi:hypothetical protein
MGFRFAIMVTESVVGAHAEALLETNGPRSFGSGKSAKVFDYSYGMRGAVTPAPPLVSTRLEN